MTLVAELDFGPDDTVAGHGPGAETEFVADYPAGMQLEAWSLVDDEPEAVGSWRPALALFGAAVVAFGVVVAGWFITNRHEDLSMPAVVGVPSVSLDPADPPTAAVEPPQIPPDAQHLPTGPALFNVLLARAGITVAPGNDGLVLAAQLGHEICGSLTQGVSAAKIEADTVTDNHFADGASPTPAQAHAFVAAAEQAFCPQYGDGQ